MRAGTREALAIGARALLLLAPMLVAWHFAAGAAAWLPAKLAAFPIQLAAGKVASSQQRGATAIYGVELVGAYRPGGAPHAEAEVEVETARYTFGVALFLALVLATRGWRRPWRVAAGLAVLLVLPAWGIAFDALRQLGQSPQAAALLGWRGGTREAIALGFQVGSLLLPTLAPIALWLATDPAAWWRIPD